MVLPGKLGERKESENLFYDMLMNIMLVLWIPINYQQNSYSPEDFLPPLALSSLSSIHHLYLPFFF